MNIALLTSDQLLISGFEQLSAQHDDSIHVYDNPSSACSAVEQQQTDVFIASDHYFDNERLCDFSEQVRAARWQPRMIMLLSNKHDPLLNATLLKESLAGGWSIIQPGQSTASVVEQLSQCIYGVKNRSHEVSNRLIQFVGTTPNIGTTVASFGVATRMAMLSGRTIAYLCLNLKSSKIHRYIGIDEPEFTLDGLRVELKSMSLTPEKLKQQCYNPKQQPNLYVLFGNMLREQAEFYTVDDMEYLLRMARGTFDYCIVDTSAYWDNAATISTIINAGMRLMVTTTQLSHFQEDTVRWLHALGPVFGHSPSSFDLLITQKEQGVHATSFSSRDIRKETSMQRIGEIHKFRDIESVLNQGRLWHAVTQDQSMGRDMERVARTVLTLFGEMTQEHRKVRGWFKPFMKQFTLRERGMRIVRDEQ